MSCNGNTNRLSIHQGKLYIIEKVFVYAVWSNHAIPQGLLQHVRSDQGGDLVLRAWSQNKNNHIVDVK